MEDKRLTVAQRKTFSAFELEECIDKSLESFSLRLFEQVTNLEVDLSYAEEKDAYGRGTIRFFYSLLLRCFQEVEAEMAMYEHRRKVEEQKKQKEAEAKRRKAKKGAEDSTALAPPPEPKPAQEPSTTSRTKLEFTALNYSGAKPSKRSVRRVVPKGPNGRPICLKFNTADGRRVGKDGQATCSDIMCSKVHVLHTKWPMELQRKIHMLGGIHDQPVFADEVEKMPGYSYPGDKHERVVRKLSEVMTAMSKPGSTILNPKPVNDQKSHLQEQVLYKGRPLEIMS
jgi:hypothetical protein